MHTTWSCGEIQSLTGLLRLVTVARLCLDMRFFLGEAGLTSSWACLCLWMGPTLYPALLPPPPPPVWSALWRSAEPLPAACPSWCRKTPHVGLEIETGDVRGHNLSWTSKQEKVFSFSHAAKIEQDDTLACTHFWQDEAIHSWFVWMVALV